ncbi:MAG TPA: MBL fold metallo-hydrolase [Methanoregulaceae archaeon]|nr:MAG: MBL fold metallo-hydrolase [Methanolinea sp.]HON82280.1 MBL fold metallo-hydrolase [Methanoregulaceae archaeon]HPD09840.1 MBL fold metallo-hydrolase [Methanoregulaceae archaeon]HRT14969.1 MBL fold metallo-hydrolase [Methanoregulaceae archaeon]HRU30416.1 MBL fold metallo-hydrolase [Methanoregulaceae archaeon]
MRCSALASGSSGNCLYVECGDDALLVDAGLSKREILFRLREAGGSEENIRGILVTHEHIDHIRGAYALARYLNVPIYATGGTLREIIRCRGTGAISIDLVRCRWQKRFEIGSFCIEAFPVSHDAREPCGFRISGNGAVLGCCTDTGVITREMEEWLSGCNMLVLESNHCPEMLRTGPYPDMLKRRIRSRRGHLSNPDAAAFIRSCCTSVARIMLAHLSEVNNTPEKALASAREAVGLFAGDLDIAVASNPGTDPGWPQRIRL